MVIVWQSARSVRLRVLDEVKSDTLDEIVHAAGHGERDVVHVDPYRQGDEQHHVGPHAHDDLPMHSHE